MYEAKNVLSKPRPQLCAEESYAKPLSGSFCWHAVVPPKYLLPNNPGKSYTYPTPSRRGARGGRQVPGTYQVVILAVISYRMLPDFLCCTAGPRIGTSNETEPLPNTAVQIRKSYRWRYLCIATYGTLRSPCSLIVCYRETPPLATVCTM